VQLMKLQLEMIEIINDEEPDIMSTALIGYTGFVGQTLVGQASFDQLYNSKNIEGIKGKHFDLVVCAGAPAVKWKANQEPETDLQNINRLIACLAEVSAECFVLISTVDVYKTPLLVDESTAINPEEVDPYGRHRGILENFVSEKFEKSVIIRLPGLFGKGLKKNVIYDFMYQNYLELIHCEGVFQFYDMSRLWQDIQIAIENEISLVNFATEPVQVSEISEFCFGVPFTNRTDKQPARYDFRSKHADIYGGSSGYMYLKQDVLNQMKRFVESEMEKTNEV
jgi:hypothetical protein